MSMVTGDRWNRNRVARLPASYRSGLSGRRDGDRGAFTATRRADMGLKKVAGSGRYSSGPRRPYRIAPIAGITLKTTP